MYCVVITVVIAFYCIFCFCLFIVLSIHVCWVDPVDDQYMQLVS